MRATLVLRRAALAAPALAAVATLVLLAGAPLGLAAAAQLVSALALAIVFVRLRPASAPPLATLASTGGALAWGVASAILAADGRSFLAVPWWLAFVVLVVVGERLELDRAIRPAGAGARALVIAALVALPSGAALALASYADGVRVMGAGMLALAAWGLARDGRHLLARAGLPRFQAVAALSAYPWLLAAGGLALAYDGVVGGLRYDALVHAVTTGFLLVAIVAHEPTFIPGVVGVALGWSRRFYVPLALLQAGVLLRVVLDLAGSADGARWGGLLTGAGMLAFVASTALAARRRRPAGIGPTGRSTLPSRPGGPETHRR